MLSDSARTAADIPSLGILPSGQNIKTTEIKPMAYVNPYQKGGAKHVFKIWGKPKRRY